MKKKRKTDKRKQERPSKKYFEQVEELHRQEQEWKREKNKITTVEDAMIL
jgi:hypothetical protein